jgi:hypothetical protein
MLPLGTRCAHLWRSHELCDLWRSHELCDLWRSHELCDLWRSHELCDLWRSHEKTQRAPRLWGSPGAVSQKLQWATEIQLMWTIFLSL